MKGTYILVIYLNKDSLIKIGALNEIKFPKGYYLYIGSAMGNMGSSTLINRVKRHLPNYLNKTIHWHIDYLLNCEFSAIIRIYLIPSEYKFECIIARDLLQCSDSYIERFGSSDCCCKSHLFYFKDLTRFLE